MSDVLYYVAKPCAKRPKKTNGLCEINMMRSDSKSYRGRFGC